MRVQRLQLAFGVLFFFAQATIAGLYACYLETAQHFAQMSEVIRPEEADKPLGSETSHCLKAYQNANKSYNSTARFFGSKAVPEWAGARYLPAGNVSSTWGQLFCYPTSLLLPYRSLALYKLKAVYRI